MANFIFDANIARYKVLLATESDAKKIATLETLLAEEQVKLADWQANNPKPAKRPTE
jgi:hypothetical protein